MRDEQRWLRAIPHVGWMRLATGGRMIHSSTSFCTVLLLLLPVAAIAADQRSTALLHRAMEAQGGEVKLRALKNVRWDASGYRNELEESERPEGPYITDFLTVTEIHDFEGKRFRAFPGSRSRQ
jgi:hypothetical protein